MCVELVWHTQARSDTGQMVLTTTEPLVVAFLSLHTHPASAWWACAGRTLALRMAWQLQTLGKCGRVEPSFALAELRTTERSALQRRRSSVTQPVAGVRGLLPVPSAWDITHGAL